MAGHLCIGQPTNNSYNVQQSNAYAEGAIYRASGIGTTVPVTDNPHEIGSGDSAAWINGWDLAESLAGVTDTVRHGCLAPLGAVPASI